MRFGVVFESFEEGRSCRRCAAGAGKWLQEQVSCQYLIGCDGGSSRVRAGGSGIQLEGQSRVGELYADPLSIDRAGSAAALGRYLALPSRRVETMIAQNDDDIWTVHVPVLPGQDATKLDPRALVEMPMPAGHSRFEILVANVRTPHLLVAETYGKGRVLPRRRLRASVHPDRRLLGMNSGSAMPSTSAGNWRRRSGLRRARSPRVV